MHLGCYGRGGPLSPCANSRHVRSENQRHRRSVRVNWWRAFILPTRGHVSIRVWRGFFRTSARGGHNFVLSPTATVSRADGRYGPGPGASRPGRRFSDEFWCGLPRYVPHVGAVACHFSRGAVWSTAAARSPLGRFSRRNAASWPLATKIRPSPDDDSVM